jgi:hypothetical protein
MAQTIIHTGLVLLMIWFIANRFLSPRGYEQYPPFRMEERKRIYSLLAFRGRKRPSLATIPTQMAGGKLEWIGPVG